LTKSVAVSLAVVLPLADWLTGGWAVVRQRWKYYTAFVAINVAFHSLCWSMSIVFIWLESVSV